MKATEQAEAINKAVEAIAWSECLIITAGAGMGVDSGLPDFRGEGGLYTEHSLFEDYNYSIGQLASPLLFQDNPSLAWGIMSVLHRIFTEATPHQGFNILKRWTNTRPHFIYTSNVDGQFQKAGFSEEHIVEVHGSVHHLQTRTPKREDDEVWPVGSLAIEVDKTTGLATSELPTCPRTGDIARLNVLMFGDFHWLPNRTQQQEQKYSAWRDSIGSRKTVIVECGAGTTIPTVHHHSNQLVRNLNDAKLIRINPELIPSPNDTIYLQMGAKNALVAIEQHLVELST